MMELNFIGCKTKEDVEKVFEDERKRLGDDIGSIDTIKKLFFDETKSEDLG